MKKITIAALALVAGGCSLVKVATKPAPTTTIKQATQMVLTDAGAFGQVGGEWLRLHPCVIEETDKGLAVEQSGTSQPAVPIPAVGCPGRTPDATVSVSPGKTARAGVVTPEVTPVTMGGGPILMDVSAIQDADDTADYYRQANAGLEGQNAVLKASNTEKTKWIVGLIAICALEFTGIALLLIRIAKRGI